MRMEETQKGEETHRGSKRFVRVDNFVNKDADDVLFIVVLWVRGSTQQLVCPPFLKRGRKRWDENKQKNL